jgi:hypothetical protein
MTTMTVLRITVELMIFTVLTTLGYKFKLFNNFYKILALALKILLTSSWKEDVGREIWRES